MYPERVSFGPAQMRELFDASATPEEWEIILKSQGLIKLEACGRGAMLQ